MGCGCLWKAQLSVGEARLSTGMAMLFGKGLTAFIDGHAIYWGKRRQVMGPFAALGCWLSEPRGLNKMQKLGHDPTT